MITRDIFHKEMMHKPHFPNKGYKLFKLIAHPSKKGGSVNKEKIRYE